MSVNILENPKEEEIKLLDSILKNKDGLIVPCSGTQLNEFPINTIRYYCLINGIYGICTFELLNQLKQLIGHKKCIEIGAGVGTFGRALGLQMFDNYLQNRPDVKLQYDLLMQPTINYGLDVLKMDAIEAIKLIRPKIVFGSWITNKYNRKRHHLGGNIYGVDEYKMFEYGVEKFLMYGSLSQHSKQPLFNDPNFNNECYQSFNLYSRKGSQDNVIFEVTPKQ